MSFTLAERAKEVGIRANTPENRATEVGIPAFRLAERAKELRFRLRKRENRKTEV